MLVAVLVEPLTMLEYVKGAGVVLEVDLESAALGAEGGALVFVEVAFVAVACFAADRPGIGSSSFFLGWAAVAEEAGSLPEPGPEVEGVVVEAEAEAEAVEVVVVDADEIEAGICASTAGCVGSFVTVVGGACVEVLGVVTEAAGVVLGAVAGSEVTLGAVASLFFLAFFSPAVSHSPSSALARGLPQTLQSLR